MDGDAALGREMAKVPNTVLGYFFFTNEEQVAHQSEELLEASADRIVGSEISAMQGSLLPGMIPIGRAVESNIDKIYKGLDVLSKTE